MNKRRLGEAVLRGGFSSAEAAVRVVNAEPWEPLPGMVKRECPECRYFFAACCEQPGTSLPGLRGQAAAREPGVTRAELIAELAASTQAAATGGC